MTKINQVNLFNILMLIIYMVGVEKDFFKLINNSDKTVENLRKRQSIEIIDNVKKAKKLTSQPNFKHTTIFCENLIACHMQKTEIYFNKPIYVG